ncbi:MAG: ABC transporter ATP-binding protein [Thermoprotei archaeon]
MSADNRILEAANLQVHFKIKVGGKKAAVRAVDGVTLGLERGVSTGVVGESGSGKTTLGKALMRLVKPTGGSVLFEGKDVSKLSRGEFKDYRRRVQMVFQDPFDAIDPLFSVYDAVAEGMRILGLYGDKAELDQAVYRALETVRLVPAEEYAKRRVTSLSGGQRQRVGVARAVAMEPDVIILDEPVSMLDASVKGEIINVMSRLKSEGKTFMMITHDISTVRFFAEKVAVMYLGKVVEVGSTYEVVGEPLHPYTQALVAAVPVPDPSQKVASLARGEIPNAIAPPSGCRFHPRCPIAQEVCKRDEPPLREVRPGRYVACHFAQ